ncbi:MAG: segregation/condensation protein A [candidate division WOR-3 bacterium]
MKDININIYQGPIDLLLYLVQRKEVDIFDIPIAQITNEYLNYIKSLKDIDFANCGDFILMATILVRMKIQALLPSSREEGGEDVLQPIALDQIIEEYNKYKQMVDLFARMEVTSGHQFARPGTKPSDEELLEFDSALLTMLLKEIRTRRTEKVYIVERETVSIEEMIKILSDNLTRDKEINLIQFLLSQDSITKIITLFIGALELVRLGEARIRQERPFGEIILALREEK